MLKDFVFKISDLISLQAKYYFYKSGESYLNRDKIKDSVHCNMIYNLECNTIT